MGYPRQYPNYSYGRDSSGMMNFHANPTPGELNSGEAFVSKVDAPDFHKKGGFYDSAIAVALTSQTPGAIVRYTTDGTEPTLGNGNDYTLPLALARVTTRWAHCLECQNSHFLDWAGFQSPDFPGFDLFRRS